VEKERRSAATNGAVNGVKTDRPRVDLNGTQAPAPAEPDRQYAFLEERRRLDQLRHLAQAKPVPASDKTADAKSSIAAKQARVEMLPRTSRPDRKHSYRPP
jgi:sRNA-binding protein